MYWTECVNCHTMLTLLLYTERQWYVNTCQFRMIATKCWTVWKPMTTLENANWSTFSYIQCTGLNNCAYYFTELIDTVHCAVLQHACWMLHLLHDCNMWLYKTWVDKQYVVITQIQWLEHTDCASLATLASTYSRNSWASNSWPWL